VNELREKLLKKIDSVVELVQYLICLLLITWRTGRWWTAMGNRITKHELQVEGRGPVERGEDEAGVWHCKGIACSVPLSGMDQ